MDPNSTYLLEIRLFGNKKKVRKDFRCFCFDMTIDSDLTNYKDLLEEIVEKYPPGYLEVAHLQYYDHDMKEFPEVHSDQDLLSMFEKNSKTKVVDMFISYCDPSEPFEPIKEWHSDVQKQAAAKNVAEDEDRYLCNLVPENEHVGVDDEVMYLEKTPCEDTNMAMIVHKDQDKEKVESEDEDEDEDEDELEIESGTELEDDQELVGHEAEHIPNREYNKEDPPMVVGSTYPSMAEFKIVLSQHAIKREFEYNTEKSAPSRFRAYCSRREEDNCPWRLHASTTDDMCTVVVIIQHK